MAKVIAIGQAVNESEREAIAYLRDHLPDSYTVIHNFELRQDRNVFEIDIALLGPHCVHVIDVKGTRGLIDVYGSKWYPEGRAPYHSPLAILRGHAKALKSFICDQHPTDRALGSIHVDAAVLMTAPDAHVQDPGGQDAPAVAYLKKCTTFFKSTGRIPSGRSTDIRAHFGKIRRSIVGRAQPRSAPPSYGNWQVEEKLGGTDRYTEYRAKHTLLGARRGGTARLRVYPVDPYLPQAERERERRRIENAFRAVAMLPGAHEHPHRAGLVSERGRRPPRPGRGGRGGARSAAARHEERAGAYLRSEDRGRARPTRGTRPCPQGRAAGGASQPDAGCRTHRRFRPRAAVRVRLCARGQGPRQHHRRRDRRRARSDVSGARVR